MRRISIAGRDIGEGCPPFIIAEVGINHNGSLETALEMIRTAKDAGADAVKFQTFRADEFISDPNVTFTYQSAGKSVTESMLEMFRRYELRPGDWGVIKERCEETGILFLSTPQNRSDLDLLLKVGIPAVKIGSDDFTNLPLLKSYARTGLPLLVSCGMSDLAEVQQALEAVGTLDGYPTILLLCTSQYPTPPADVNLLKLATLAAAYPSLVLGFSDHTQGPLASSLAVAMGASLFEKHFTLGHGLPGPDHWFSEEPAGLKEWIDSIRKAHVMMGSALVRPTAAEKSMRALARRSIVALKAIGEGEILGEDNLGLRRPGTGLNPGFWDALMGKKALRGIAKGDQLRMGDFS
ncbi:MAG TPA: N-acetylneuraminate synthase family protein [Fibrobacteria bacterium]|nr:N-acetylneuraminate synthase family protein [Fibrobacteria bacterium]